METLTIEQENKLIDDYDTTEFYRVMLEEFGAVGVATILGYATLYGLTLKSDPKQARQVLVAWGWSERGVYGMYKEFRRLRRVLLARRGCAMQEQRGGPGMNDGIPVVAAKACKLLSVAV